MRLVIQRVKEASVKVERQMVGQIKQGILVFLGVAETDTLQEAEYLADKVSQLRIFEDEQGKMNLSAEESNAEFLVVSQFTILADCQKGRRPSFDAAAEPTKAEGLYNYFVEQLRAKGFNVQTGQFRAMMDVTLVNDGPVTFVVDSKD